MQTKRAINLREKFGMFEEQWKPRVIAEMNDYQFKLVKLEGDFVWHSHAETDETFFVIEGELRIELRIDGGDGIDGIDGGDGAVTIGPGEMFVVPKGVEHKPFAAREVKLMLIEPKGVVNTGDAGGEMTAKNDVWV
jgi:mannose-6-phosphate isomerase-like protein (cupin superfamily)